MVGIKTAYMRTKGKYFILLHFKVKEYSAILMEIKNRKDKWS